jgi:2-dehydro-3-deoxygluconokinase
VPPRVVALGEAMLRLSPPGGGRLDDARSLEVHVAGSELNVAVALSSLGVSTRWISALPDTPLGRRVLADARAAGVDTRYVQLLAGRMGLFFIEFGSEPRPTSVWYDRDGSAFRQLDDIDGLAVDGARYAVVSGVTPALGASGQALTTRFAERAQEAGAGLCVDVNHRSRLWSAEDARAALTPLLERAEVVVCSQADAAEVFDIRAGTRDAVLEELRERHAPQAELVVITMGADGVVASERGRSFAYQPAFDSAVRDRIGGGDAFVAGLLWGLLEEAGVPDSLARGTALAALKQTVAGDLARFTPAEVMEVIANPNKVLVR